MKTPQETLRSSEAIARDIVAKLEHGDETHRAWLRDNATPLLVAAIEAERKEAERMTVVAADYQDLYLKANAELTANIERKQAWPSDQTLEDAAIYYADTKPHNNFWAFLAGISWLRARMEEKVGT